MNLWQDLADHILPSTNRFTLKESPGLQRHQYIYDSHPEHAVHLWASSLHSMVFGNAMKWFGLTVSNKEVASRGRVIHALQERTDIMLDVLSQSNFYGQAYEMLPGLIVFGTSCMSCLEDEETAVRFKNTHLAEVIIRPNARGDVDTVFRKFNMTLRNLYSQFPGYDFDDMKREYGTAGETSIEICHAVFPSDDYGMNYWDSNMPYTSLYFTSNGKHLLSVGGFEDFPYFVTRWFVGPGEDYGRSPGMQALPDIKTLYAMSRTSLATAQKMADPPLAVSEGYTSAPLKMGPGDINYTRPAMGNITQFAPTGDLSYAHSEISDRRAQIRSIFFNDQLQLLNKTMMTATEVVQRVEETRRILSPINERLESDFLRRVVMRVYNVLDRKGYFPDAPVEFEEFGVDVEFLSPLARAQRMNDLNSVTRLFEVLAPFAQVNPQILQGVSGEDLLQYASKVLGVPREVLKSKYEVQEEKEAAARLMQMQLESQQAQSFTESLETVAGAQEKSAKAQTLVEGIS